MNELLYKEKARKKLQKGVDTCADAVKVTLGAKGRNVTIQRAPGQRPHITKDGVTVANSILRLADPYEDMGLQMVKGAARETMNQAGDGTTTSTILAQAIFNGGLLAIEAGHNPMDIKKGIDKAVEVAIESIKKQSRKIEENVDQLYNVAFISSNGDKEIATVVTSSISAVGKKGIVSVVKSKTKETTMEVVEGMQFDRGYTSPYFETNKGKGLAELDSPYILLFDGKISKLGDILPILETVQGNSASLLIIAEDVDGEAFATICANVVGKKLRACIARAPFGGVEGLEDIAVVTGATVVSQSKGHMLKNMPLNYLGRAENIRVSVDATLIAGGKGDKHQIKERIKNLESQKEATTPEDQFRFERRLDRLSESAAIIFVGAETESEVLEKKDRVDDAIKAIRAAMEEGAVAGGGVAYMNARRVVDKMNLANKAESAGRDVVVAALQEPMRQIFMNAGLDCDSIFKAITGEQEDYGFNVRSECYEPFFATGIIDPAKVSRVALEKAASMSGILLTTEVLIVDIPG